MTVSTFRSCRQYEHRGCDHGESVSAEQKNLFDLPPKDWEEHWQGMPEYVTSKSRPYAEIMVRFRSQEDLDEFCQLIGQRLKPNSQCTWHPELPPLGRGSQERWVDES